MNVPGPTWLVVLRGNSGSGKSTTARCLQERFGRGMAWVEQDHFRRVVLRERDVPAGANIGLIDQTVRYALGHGYHVALEGILDAGRYGAMLAGLHADLPGRTAFFYFDVSFEETARRHAGRPQAAHFSVDDMYGWYKEKDLLSFVAEEVVPEEATLDRSVARVLARLPAVR